MTRGSLRDRIHPQSRESGLLHQGLGLVEARIARIGLARGGRALRGPPRDAASSWQGPRAGPREGRDGRPALDTVRTPRRGGHRPADRAAASSCRPAERASSARRRAAPPGNHPMRPRSCCARRTGGRDPGDRRQGIWSDSTARKHRSASSNCSRLQKLSPASRSTRLHHRLLREFVPGDLLETAIRSGSASASSPRPPD